MDLVEFYEARGARVIVLSEYGLTDVSTPVHPNRAAPRARPARRSRRARARGARSGRERGLRRRRSPGGARLRERPAAPRGGSRAPRRTAGRRRRPRARTRRRAHRIDHARAGDLVAVATPDAWFTYYYWLDDERAPDYARTVDIHRKPGYDPVELFLDPAICRCRRCRSAGSWRSGRLASARCSTSSRSTPRSSAARTAAPAIGTHDGPLIASRSDGLLGADRLTSVDVHDVILRHIFEDR